MKPLAEKTINVTLKQFHAACLAFADLRHELAIYARNQTGEWETGFPLPLGSYRAELMFTWHAWGFYVTATEVAEITKIVVTADETKGSAGAWEAWFAAIFEELLAYASGNASIATQGFRPSAREQFTISDTLSNFIGWLNSYGEARQPDFKPSGKPVKFLGPSKVMAIHHTVTVGGGEIAGYIPMDILPIDAEHLEVSAGIFAQIDIIGRTTPGIENPYQNELEAYFAELIQAIRKRWPQREGKPKEEGSIHRPFGWEKKPILKCNQWLATQYFEYDRTNLKELVKDWEQIRREKDRAEDVQNSIKSMTSFVHAEKKRRAR